MLKYPLFFPLQALRGSAALIYHPLYAEAYTRKCRKKDEEGCQSCHCWDRISTEPFKGSFQFIITFLPAVVVTDVNNDNMVLKQTEIWEHGKLATTKVDVVRNTRRTNVKQLNQVMNFIWCIASIAKNGLGEVSTRWLILIDCVQKLCFKVTILSSVRQADNII